MEVPGQEGSQRPLVKYLFDVLDEALVLILIVFVWLLNRED